MGREKGSQWGVPAHGGCVTPRFAVASMENENWRMGLQACIGWVNNDDAKHAIKNQRSGN